MTRVSEPILIAANLVPFRDAGQRQRQDACVTSINALASKRVIPLNICYPDELLEPAGWQTAPILQRSADLTLGIDVKRKPFVNDIFDINYERTVAAEIEWCYAQVEDGKFGDQLYLNDWPERFRGVKVLENVGAGVAPWNHEQYDYSTDVLGRILVDGTPLVFYHFHSLAFVVPELIIPAKYTHYPMREEVIRLCVRPYIRSLMRAIASIRRELAEFSFGLYNNNVLTQEHTFVARKELAEQIRNLGVKHPTFDLGDGWECYLSEQTVYPETRKRQPAPQPKIKSEALRLNQAGEAAYQQGNIDEAFRLFAEAIRIDQSCVVAHNNLGVLFWERGDKENSLAYLSRALDLDPNNGEAVINISTILVTLNEQKRAKRICEQYLQQNPDDSELRQLANTLQ